MSIGDVRILEHGRIERVISETPIRNYCTETKEQETARIKKGLPPPMYGYIAVKTEVVTGDQVNASSKQNLAKEAKDLLKMPDEKRQAYYQKAIEHRGIKEINQLIAEVKKQRRLQNSKEMSL